MSFTVLEKGVKFECQGSGKCCLSRGEYGYVYMTLKDRRQMAKVLGLSTTSFTKKYCDKQSDGLYHLKSKSEECMFLDGNQCEVYEGRPTQCRTWPFWPEVMNAKSWKKEVKDFCPGVGRGKYYSPQEIKEILEFQKRSESEV